MSKRIVKYAENACEYKTMEITASELGALSRKPQQDFTRLYDDYICDLALPPKDHKSLQSEITKRSSLCSAAGVSLAKSLVDNYPNKSFAIIPFNKEGLKQGVGQKSDINIEIYDGNKFIDIREISLKLYIASYKKGRLSIQVASGTYFSTLCGLGFEVSGRGSFLDSHGKKFNSKKSNMQNIIKTFKETYGASTAPHLKEVLRLTNETHTLRDCATKPKDMNSIRKSIGTNAVQPFIDLLSEMADGALLRQSLLKRLGLINSPNKEILAVCYSDSAKKKPQVFNSIGNLEFHKNIRLLNHSGTTLTFTKDGQGVRFSFRTAEGVDILNAKMPLTININGAWANEDRYDKLDDCHYKKGERRVTKSKQLDTSTNFYLDIGQIFKLNT